MSAAIVCGSGPDFWKDFARAQAAAPGAHVIGVNFTSLFLPRVHDIVSLHSGLPPKAREMREELDWNKQGPKPPVTWAISAHPGIDRVYKPEGGIAGTSALYAVRVALHQGFDRIILAGVPLDGSGRFFDPPNTPHVWEHQHDRGPWEIAAKLEFAGKVTSCSGWTAELLGEPT